LPAKEEKSDAARATAKQPAVADGLIWHPEFVSLVSLQVIDEAKTIKANSTLT
jgi:hypothetical protein